MADDQDTLRSDQTIITHIRDLVAPVAKIGHYISYAPNGTPRRILIGPEGITIGRHPSCTIVFAVPEISRQHCRIDLEGDSVTVHDLGSTNGTFVAGSRIDRPTRLGNGSHISLGSFLLRYEQRDAQEVMEEARLTTELREAVEYVRTILPEPITTGPVQARWLYIPSSELGGDAFGYQYLDETTLAGFLLDVCGHGIGPSMHGVAVANVLRRKALPGVDFHDPGAVVAGLNTMFPMEEHGSLIFTLWYFVYDVTSRIMRFCSAGHHPAYLVAPGEPDPAPVWLRSPLVGMLPPRAWPSEQIAIRPNSRLYLFSDGAFEIEQPDGTQWQIDHLRRIIGAGPESGASEAQRVFQAVRSSARPGPLADDFSILVLHFL
jgi:serine phosphatase RsbU (regulator of sigma subunit)